MSAFTLDTSGEVAVPEGSIGRVEIMRRTKWRDLDPFTQGYVEALFAELADRVFIPPDERDADSAFRAAAFSDLSPSALEQIVRDCREFQRACGGMKLSARDGKRFWNDRQAAFRFATWVSQFATIFPPLTVSLDDAGKVTLADRVRA